MFIVNYLQNTSVKVAILSINFTSITLYVNNSYFDYYIKNELKNIIFVYLKRLKKIDKPLTNVLINIKFTKR